MAVIVIYDPAHPKVTNAVTQFLPSAHPPDHSGETNKVTNPDLSLLWTSPQGPYIVPLRYWKWGGGNLIVEMNTTEKDTVDAIDPEVKVFNEGVTGVGPKVAVDAAIEVERGSPANASFRWDETLETWVIGLFGQEIEVADVDQVPTNITDLGDVREPMSPSDGQVLTWNNGNSEWENADPAHQITVKEQGSSLGLFNSLNFLGAAITATDGGGGEADITVAAAPLVHTHTESDITDLGNYAVIGGAHHDGFSDFVANEHINHTSVTLTAGAGLSGGGDISANRTFTINVQNSIEIATDTLQLVGDAASPGNDKVYGTNGSGVKGWYDQSGGAINLGDLGDVTITTPSTDDALIYTGSVWENIAIETGAATKTISSWSLESGDLYSNTFNHGLDTTAIAAWAYDTVTAKQVRFEDVEVVDANNIKVYVRGNTHNNINLNVVTGRGPRGPQGATGPAGGGLANIVEDTTPQLGGDLDMNQWNLHFNSSLSVNLSSSGIIVTATVDSNSIGFGAALAMAVDGNFDLADAEDVDQNTPCRALAVETGTGSKKLLLQGFIRNDSWNWTVGGDLYLSTTAGTLTQTAPSGSGDHVQKVGYAWTADIVYFSPGDYTIVEVA